MAVQTETPSQSWVYIVAGVIAILFGLVAIIWPHLTLGLLVIFFGVYALIGGVVSLIDMFRRIGRHETWWTSLLIGIVSIIAGVYVLANPGISTVILAWTIAFWAIILGITEIVGSLTGGNFLLLIVGVLTVVFGFILLGNPLAGALSLVWVIGIFAIIRGILLLLMAFRTPNVPAMTA